MAATDLERLVVQLSADINKFDRSLARAQGVANKRLGSIESRFVKMSKTLNAGAATATAGLARTFAVIGGAQGLKTLSDSATRIDNALKVAGLSGAELEGVYQQLFAAATKNAAPIETLVGLYGRLALVQNELGVSQQQIVGFSNNIALALRVGGTSATEASGALLQLSQALGGGVVRAEEFNSVLEGAPTILQAAAAGIKEADGSVAKLRQIMLDGKLSSKAFFDGFQAGAPILDQKIAGAVLTIDQRLTNLNTALINAAREFNNSSAAGEAFGSEIDRVAGFINSINFDALIGQIQAIIGTLNSGITAANGLAQAIGNLAGLDNVGAGIVSALGGKDGKASFFGGALTIESTKAANDLNTLTEKRLDLEKSIEDTKANGALTDRARTKALADYNKQLVDVNSKIPALPEPKIEGGPLVYDRFNPTASTTVKPISINDTKYTVPASSSGGGKKKGGGNSSVDDLQREIQQIKDRTLALRSETEAQAGLNPLLDDYGFAVEKAAAKHDLLIAAQQAGKTVTPELAAQIDGLATAYANAVVASERLAKSQDDIRQKAEDAREFNKDLTRGIVDGFIEGKKAADVFADALSKIGDRLLDLAFDQAFAAPGSSTGGFDIGSLFKGLFREKGGPVKAGQPYIVGEKRPELFVPNQSGRIVPRVPSAPTLPSVAGKSGGTTSITYAPVIDNRGADAAAVARLEQIMARDKATFEARVVTAVSGANSRGVRMNGDR